MIGVFDSGFGGLTVLKQFLIDLGEYDYCYLGDNARAPYGEKTEETIYQYAKEAIDFLFGKNCELIIFACNTASAKALRKIQQEYLIKNYPGKRVLGVLVPAAEELGKFDFEKVGVIATEATVNSGAYTREIKKVNEKLEVIEKACPRLVSLIEKESSREEIDAALKEYLLPLQEAKINALILGCTHYPILKNEIKEIMGKEIMVFDSPKIVAEKLRDYLKRHPEIEAKLIKNKKRIFYTTGEEVVFDAFAGKFLGEEFFKKSERVELE